MPEVIDENHYASKGDKFLVASSLRMSVWKTTKGENKKALLLSWIWKKFITRQIGTFLDFALAKKSFGAKWRSWIYGCIFSAFFVIINGSRGYFSASRGLVTFPLYISH